MVRPNAPKPIVGVPRLGLHTMYQSMPIAAFGVAQILRYLVSFLPAAGDKQKPG